jgi:ribonuclease BN (tRNA processing enzyme)
MRQSTLALLMAAALAAPAAHGALDAQDAQDARRTRVVLLGTGTPNPDPERSGPGVAIVVGGSVYLVDAGPGIVRRAEAARRAGVAQLEQPNLKIVFLTHLHSDHTLGLADLIFTPWVLERTAPLAVYGPRGTRAMTAHLTAAYIEDQRGRLDGWQPQNRTGQKVVAHEIRPGLVYSDSNVRVIAFLVEHGTWKEAYGYRFETADRTIVVSGDTRPSDAVVQACNGCDVLVHEVYSTAGFATRPAEWRRYHARFHTSSEELAQIATRARPGLLVLTHQLLWGTTPEQLLEEIRRAGYAGRVVSGKDLDVF